MKKALRGRVTKDILISAAVLLGISLVYFVILKIAQERHASSSGTVMALCVYFSACLYSFLGYRYFKYVRGESYKKIAFTGIASGFFVLGAVLTYIAANFISLYLSVFFTAVFNIDTATSPTYDVSVFSIYMCAVSCIIAIAVYNILKARQKYSEEESVEYRKANDAQNELGVN